MHSGHSGKLTMREWYVPVHTIAQNIDPRVLKCLPAAHALTGCDTTSSFFKIGKQTAFNKLSQNIECVDKLSEFGDFSAGVNTVVKLARSFVLCLYGLKGQSCSSLDELRYKLATTTDKPAHALPPTDDAFQQHVLRARYQIAI